MTTVAIRLKLLWPKNMKLMVIDGLIPVRILILDMPILFLERRGMGNLPTAMNPNMLDMVSYRVDWYGCMAKQLLILPLEVFTNPPFE